MTAIILLFSSLLLAVQAKFNITQFTKGFNSHLENDEQLKPLVKHGFECLYNGFQFLDSFLDGSQENSNLGFHSLLQETKAFAEVVKCVSTLQTLTSLVRKHLNTTFIRTHFELSYPEIIQSLYYFVDEPTFIDSETFGSNAFFALQAIFFTGGYNTKYFVNPTQTVDFDFSRFYTEFFTDFFERFFEKRSKAFKEMTNCLNTTQFLVADLGHPGQSIQDQFFGFAIRAPQLMEEFGECLRSANNTMLSFSMFSQAVKDDPKTFLKSLRRNTMKGANILQRHYTLGVEKILEGRYSEAGSYFGRFFREMLGPYARFFQSELAYLIENGLIDSKKPFPLY